MFLSLPGAEIHEAIRHVILLKAHLLIIDQQTWENSKSELESSGVSKIVKVLKPEELEYALKRGDIYDKICFSNSSVISIDIEKDIENSIFHRGIRIVSIL